MDKKILMIEDDDLLIRMYDQAFAASGITAEYATNGPDGLIKAKQLRPALILLDVMMPGMTGIQVLAELKNDADLKAIPVIMLTSLSGPSIEEEVKAKGALEFLDKSNTKPRELVQKIKAILQTP